MNKFSEPTESTGPGVDAMEHLAYLIADMFIEESNDQLADQLLTRENFLALGSPTFEEAEPLKAFAAGAPLP
jgi:hypothetical protein